MILLGFDNYKNSYVVKKITSHHHRTINFVILENIDLIYFGIT